MARSIKESIPVAICSEIKSEVLLIVVPIVSFIPGRKAYRQVKNVESPILIATGILIARNIIKLTVSIIADIEVVSMSNLAFYLLSDFLERKEEFLIIVSIEKTKMKKPLIGTTR